MTTMTTDQFFNQLDEIFGTDDGYINHLERIKALKEQLNHYQDACEEINTICGCDPCDPAVNSVSDLKQEMKRQIFKELEDELEKINQSKDSS